MKREHLTAEHNAIVQVCALSRARMQTWSRHLHF